MRLFLASASPRRARLLKEAGIPFRIVRSNYRETERKGVGPVRLIRAHAMGKARGALQGVRQGVVLGADTIVVFRKKILGKPANLRAARVMLGALQGHRHAVFTGVALLSIRNGRMVLSQFFYEKTSVTLRNMTPEDILRYFKRVDPLDKAGAYAIQEKRASIIRKVEGSRANAIGLPMEKLKTRLDMIR